MKYICVSCHAELPQDVKSCPSCSMAYAISERTITYNADSLLRNLDYHAWALWKVLNNNGYLSYHWLQSASISLSERPDVTRFRHFIESQIKRGVLLDVGCGTLEVPGYIDFDDKTGVEFYGLDPIGESVFKWNRVVGCSEFMPFPDASIDTIIFATSLDHVCSLDKTLSEVSRLLSHDGRIIVWMSDRGMDLTDSLKYWGKRFLRRIKHGFRVDRFCEFDTGIVLYMPPGAVDPFHAYFEDPENIIKRMKAHGLSLLAREEHTRDEVFLSFGRRNL